MPRVQSLSLADMPNPLASSDLSDRGLYRPERERDRRESDISLSRGWSGEVSAYSEFTESSTEEDDVQDGVPLLPLNKDPKLPPRTPSSQGSPNPLAAPASAPAKKPAKSDDDDLPIRQPVRVEPKTFFSNERTLLQWINAVVVLSTVAIALINLGEAKARISGFILLPVAVLFGIYSLSIFHFRLAAITERRNSKIFEDSFGPYILVFIIALILSAVIPSLHVNSQMGTKYPFIPGNLPYSPELYEYTAPLGQNLFPYANRTVGLANVVNLLESFSLDILNQFTIKETKKGHIDKAFAEPLIYTVYGIDNSTHREFKLVTVMPYDKTILDVYNHLGLRSVPLPQHNSSIASGRTNFVMAVNCNRAAFVVRSVLKKAVSPKTLSELDYYFPGATKSLPDVLNPGAKISSNQEEHYLWKQDVIIGDTPALITLELIYYSPTRIIPANALPIAAHLGITFQDTFRTEKTLSATGTLLTKLINEQWEKWPTDYY